MKKFLSLIFLSIFCLNAINAEVTWKLEGNTLTISGTGDMETCYTSTWAPWGHLYNSIKNVIISDGVTNIGSAAFLGCLNLKNVIIPNSVKTIGSSAFNGCTNLTSITIPYGVINIEGGAFHDCKNLSSISIPNSVTSIDISAFYDCCSLTSIYIPNSVKYIGENAFHNCYSLSSINVEEGNMFYDSREDCNAIIRKEDNALILGCKNTFIPNNIICIASNAFDGCKYLTSIIIPDGVMFIDGGAFNGCRSLSSVTIPNSVIYIGNTFENCNILEDNFVNYSNCECVFNTIDIEQGDGLLIKDNKVIGCRARAISVTIPDNVTSIENYAFEGCNQLVSVKVPNSVTNIGSHAFQDCI